MGESLIYTTFTNQKDIEADEQYFNSLNQKIMNNHSKWGIYTVLISVRALSICKMVEKLTFFQKSLTYFKATKIDQIFTVNLTFTT